MSFEDTLAAVLEAKLSPMKEQIARMASELGALRKALPPQLVTLAEASRVLGVSCSTIRRRMKAGEIPTKRIGRSVRIDLSAMKAPTSDEVNANVLRLKAG